MLEKILRSVFLFGATFGIPTVILVAVTTRAQFGGSEAEPHEEVVPFELRTIDGTLISNADLKGKVVLMDFWASWCRPCLIGFPAYDDLYQKYKDNDKVAFLAVNIADRDSFENMEGFVERHQYSFDFVYDEVGALSRQMTSTGIPSMILLNKEGEVVLSQLGLPSDGFHELLEDQINSLL